MNLLPLDAAEWQTFCGGYNRAPFNCVPLIEQLRATGTSEKFWTIVWDELHHQGDVGEATYAIVPYLAEHFLHSVEFDLQLLAFVAIVEYERHRNKNPPIPAVLVNGYNWAIEAVLTKTLQLTPNNWSSDVMRYYAALVATWKRLPVMSAAYQELDETEAREFLVRFYDDESWRHD